MGDIGGLYEGLYFTAWYLIRPIATMLFNTELLSQTFKIVKEDREKKIVERSKIPFRHSIKSVALCCFKKSRYRRMMDRANYRITRQLDLVKFLQ